MYRRVVLKISGEALKGDGQYGIDPKTVKKIAQEIKSVHQAGIEVAVVVGAGNLWRGKTGEELGMDRAQADYMGMLGTIMNSLAMQDALESIGVPSRVMTSILISAVAEPYVRRRALRHLEKDHVVIFAGGTGSPYFSTDTAAALRAAEIDAEVILMAKNNTNGVYDKDPRLNSDARLYDKLTLKEVITHELGVMDATAASICKENQIALVVFNMNETGNIKQAVMRENIGTVVSWEDEKNE